MASIWLVRNGPNPNTGDAAYTLPLSEIVAEVDESRLRYLCALDGPPPKFNVEVDTGKLAGYRHVVLEVPEIEATGKFESGYYRAEIGIEEIIDIFGTLALPVKDMPTEL